MKNIMYFILFLITIIIINPKHSYATEVCIPDNKPVIHNLPDQFEYEIDSPEPDWLEGVYLTDSCGKQIVNTSSISITKSSDFDLNKENDEENPYTIFFHAQNTTEERPVFVYYDITPPILIGPIHITVEVNDFDFDFLKGFTATDNKDSTVQEKIEYDFNPEELVREIGIYIVIYSVLDNHGNKTELEVTIEVVDTTPPEMTGVSDLTIEVHTDLSLYDWWEGIIVTDNSQKEVDKEVVYDINSAKLGKYEVLYRVTDHVGNKTEQTINVHIVDTTPPEILNIGDIKININNTENINWIEGVKIIDNYDGEMSIDYLIVDCSDVNLEKPGIYSLRFIAIDSNGNKVVEVISVRVFDDDIPMIHNLKDLRIKVNSNFDFLEGITATDPTDGDITDRIILYDQYVNLSKIGTYFLTYIVFDRSGNPYSETIKVTVYDDSIPEINGTRDLTLEVFTVFTRDDFLEGVSAYDLYDGDLTNEIIVDYSEVNFEVLGTYLVRYSVTDSSENETYIEIYVHIVDTTKPVLIGIQDKITIYEGEEIDLLAGVEAIDNYDGNLTVQIRVVGNYNIHQSGSYLIRYEVEDFSGNMTFKYMELIVVAPIVDDGVKNKTDYTNYYIISVIAVSLIGAGAIGILTRRRK